MEPQYPGRPSPLRHIFPKYRPPLYFVTICTFDRKPVLANNPVHQSFKAYANHGLAEFQIRIGHYMIMPDHIHLFIRGKPGFDLRMWGRGLKRALDLAIYKTGIQGDIWQPGLFDHVLRNAKSYGEKIEYVTDNPVRKGLVRNQADWLYQGRIVELPY